MNHNTSKMKHFFTISTILLFGINYNYQKAFSVQYANQADKKLFFVEYQNQADLKIYFVDYKNQAVWRNKAKEHLIY
ncbi:DUF6150 family protein [Psychroflexus maritimus]|uniref:DUF6150 family protein n=1 Tax=Psychroflexus maritimus TaxID=2714865 RepID=UPI00293BC5C4|nr:DUF6150 family protein [Psychroflexus maritimus]